MMSQTPRILMTVAQWSNSRTRMINAKSKRTLPILLMRLIKVT